MTLDLLKSFIKYSYKTWCIGLAIGAILTLVHFVGWEYFALFLMGILRDAYHFKERLAKIYKLKSQGLTEEDLENIAFVKKWEETRTSGVWNYCITNGALIVGFSLIIPVSLLYVIFSHKTITELLPDLGKMFGSIAYSYLIGAIIGTIGCRIAWTIKERRFLRLTDPLNTIFTARKESFTDLI